MPMSNLTISSAIVALVMLTPGAVGGADEPPAYASATEAYRQGAGALKTGEMGAALPALEYAAKHGVLGAQLKLARAYAAGRDVPRNDVKAFFYFQQIADQQAEISSSSPIAKYVGEAFVALGQYYAAGIPAMPLAADPAYAVGLFRHAASYFGNAEAQYQLGRLYLAGEGVEKNPSLAVNWLAIAARKQHPAAQALLGKLLWRGTEVRQRQARGLALLTLAQENAKASGRDQAWIGELYQEAFGESDNAVRKEAEAMLPQLGGPARASQAGSTRAAPAEQGVVPASRASVPLPVTPPPAPVETAPLSTAPLSSADGTPPASLGLSVGFGATEVQR